MMTARVCQLRLLQQRTYVFTKSPGYNLHTQTLKGSRLVKSNSPALNSSKNVFGRDLQLLNSKRYSSDQSSAPGNRRLLLTAKLLLATSGVASVVYYTVHTTTGSNVLAKQREVPESSASTSREPHVVSEEYVNTKISELLNKHGEDKNDFKQAMEDVGLWPDITVKTSKIFSDPIHGNITIHPVCVAVINTPEFQRLRDIKQLGMNSFVYPGATHSRFEHSLGVCYLAGKFVRQLKANQPELGINDKDILCLELAGLCHDLGHGPYSHVFDGKVVPLLQNVSPKKKQDWKHENASRHLFDYIYNEHKEVRDEFEKYSLDEKDRNFIKALVKGKKKSEENTGRGTDKDFLYENTGRGTDKDFLYEIVANDQNGIDVDKWDYIARDCHQLGIRSTFDHSRFMKFARVETVEKDGVKEPHICLRDKELINVYDLFRSRYVLHRVAYQHKVTYALEIMVAQAIRMADKHLRFGGKTISEIIDQEDWEAYTLLTDNILFKIRDDVSDEMKDAKDIIDKIFSRKFFKCVAESPTFVPKKATEKAKESAEKAKESAEKAKESAEKEERIKQDIFKKYGLPETIKKDVFVKVVNFDFGFKEKKNPLEHIYVFKKNGELITIPDEISRILKPYTCKEQIIRVYVKDTVTDDNRKLIKQAFEDWKKNDFPNEKATMTEAEIQQKIILDCVQVVKNKDGFFVKIVDLDFGMKDENPVEKLNVYSKHKPDDAKHFSKEEVCEKCQNPV